MTWKCISPEVTVKDFNKSCIFSAVDETDDMLWNDSEGMSGVSVRKMKALTVKMVTGHRLVKVDRT